MAETLPRIPPQSPDAEDYVLGCMILGDKPATFKILEKLKPQDFYKEVHQKIFEAAQELFQKGKPIDMITLPQHLQEQGKLEEIGGRAYLASLTDIVPLATSVDHYIQLILEKSLRRQMISAGLKIVDLGYDEESDLEDVLGQAESQLYQVSLSGARKEFTDFSSLMGQVYTSIHEAYRNIQTGGSPYPYPYSGYDDLDEIISGFRPSDLVILAGRPSMGKTSLALNLAYNVASQKRRDCSVAFFSLEMSEPQIGLRLLSQLSGINTQKISLRWLSETDWEKLGNTISRLEEVPLYFDHSPGITPVEIKAKCRRLKLERGLGLVVIDYLQLIQSKKKIENRVQEVSEITRSLKIMAKELDVCVLALSQLSRYIERREDRRPVLADLRESGAIEQDADIVMFIHDPRPPADTLEESPEGNGEVLTGEMEPEERDVLRPYVLRITLAPGPASETLNIPEVENYIRSQRGNIDFADLRERHPLTSASSPAEGETSTEIAQPERYFILYHFTLPSLRLKGLQERMEILRQQGKIQNYKLFGPSLRKIELLVLKNRHGATGKIPMWFQRDINRFSSVFPE